MRNEGLIGALAVAAASVLWGTTGTAAALAPEVGAAAIVALGFVCAIGRMVLTTEIIGYCLMGLLLLLAILRTVVFCLMDAKGY